MKLRSSVFVFSVPGQLAPVTVAFRDDFIRVYWSAANGERKHWSVENKPGKWGGRPWKPCVTHCERLISNTLKQAAQPAGTARREDKNSSRRKRPHNTLPPTNPPRLRCLPNS